MLSISTILGITNWCFVYIAILIFLIIFYIIFKCRRELRDISLLLTCNTCLAALLTCIASCVMTSSNLSSGFLTYNMDFCDVWGLFYDICECSIYHSYCLQAFFRLCRIVFYKKKILVSYSLYSILIIGQWLLVFILLIPPVFLKWYTRLSTEKYCLISYTYIGPEVYHILVLYLVPLICITITYFWITRFLRNAYRTSTVVIAVVQRQRNQRDLIVIKRIVMSVSVLIVLRFPTIIFMIHGAIVGALYPLTYGIVGVITSACLILIGLITINITPYIRKSILDFFIQRNNRIHAGGVPLNQMNTPIAVITNNHTTQKS